LVPRVDSVGATQDENAVARGPFSR